MTENFMIGIGNTRLYHYLINPKGVTCEVTYQTLTPEHDEYRKLLWQNRYLSEEVHILSIQKIENRFLAEKYEEVKQNKSEFEEMLLFHGTHSRLADTICTYNLTWRLCKDPAYGWGVYFSKYPRFAAYYPDAKRGFEIERIMLCFKVLIGKMCEGKRGLQYPEAGCDTAIKLWDGPGPGEYVKFEDYEYYPVYKIKYVKNEDWEEYKREFPEQFQQLSINPEETVGNEPVTQN